MTAPIIEKSFRINNTIDTSDPRYVNKTQYNQYPFNFNFYLNAGQYAKFEVMSIVSVRFNNIFHNSGYFYVDNM